ncbi:hypothetical protein P1X14_10695 [Sphingomonas sp. AOB5]|uniref:hypothetical protein n=1 Tax=Sphingomonas sp. AOB5 TaxID=3034017 RepID=UPI0023F64E10|nr:hypothetical protein [Sphingomonas sp. AOB5]MDF7775715.1 hypothetical protein [Sphingomonas sp. AOB5]
MKSVTILCATLCALAVAGCNQSPADKLAARVENAAEARAAALEKQAEELKDQARRIREGGDERADAIDAAGRNVAAMTQEQRDAIVANEAPAVR